MKPEETTNFTNQIIEGDAAKVLNGVPARKIDLVVTDPPYLVNYRDRTGRSLQNDNSPERVMPVFSSMARAMKQDSYAICFAGWSALRLFTQSWEGAGLRIVSEIVWRKQYTSRNGYTQYRHESAYVLAKGNPPKPARPLPSVMDWVYSGNTRHPTEKSVKVIAPLIRCFSEPGDLVCDPFSGSGSTSVAALLNDRRYLGIEVDKAHCETARGRLRRVEAYKARTSSSAVRVAA